MGMEDVPRATLEAPRVFFEALSLFDWITPGAAMLDLYVNDPTFGFNSWTFFIPNTPSIRRGWDQLSIERVLAANSIHTYGSIVSFGMIMFCVPIHRAARTEYILDRLGIPMSEISRGAPSIARRGPVYA